MLFILLNEFVDGIGGVGGVGGMVVINFFISVFIFCI